MATKGRTAKRKKKVALSEQLRATVLRPEVIGVVLVLISAFTLLSLVTGSRGSVTDAWIRGLETLVGVGVWGLPVVTGVLGFWMVIYAIERMPNVAWQRPVGFGFLLLAYVITASLLLPLNVRSLNGASQRDAFQSGGGLIGRTLATALERAIGFWGAWVAVLLIVLTGILFLTDRFLLEKAEDLWFWLQNRDLRPRRPGGPSDFSPSDYPQGGQQTPAERLWQKMIALGVSIKPKPTAPTPDLGHDGNFVQSAPSQIRSASDSGIPNAKRATPSNRSAKDSAVAKNSHAKPPTEPDRGGMLSPRIIGGAGQALQLPDINKILGNWERIVDGDDVIREQGKLIQETLALFGVPASFEGAYKGPSVTQYLIKPGYVERTVKGELTRTKVKIAKIAGLANDLALALAAPNVRIEAPIPGTSYVGVEVPNHEGNRVGLKDLMESEAFEKRRKSGKLVIALGEDVKGNAIVADMARMPHLLIAGATGAGKSVCINSIIGCLLLTHTPETLRLLMIDPKMVELSVYNGIPHLLSPVVTEVDKASGVLYWAVKEMERRYQLCSKANVRDLERYNSYLNKRGEKPLPYIVIVIDEMADLMMAAPEEVEKYVCRLAQMARAVGIHLILATQRPSVDVITGLIKANFPSRIAFAVTSQTDSRVILDVPGAERLLGKGDMLFMAPDASKLERIQGAWLHDDEINSLIRYWKGFRTLENGRGDSITPADLAADPPADPPSVQKELDPLDDLFDSADAKRARNRQRPPATAPSTGELGLGATPRARGTAWTDRPRPTIPDDPLEQPALFEQIDEMKAIDARDVLFEEAARVVQKEGRGSVSLLQRKLRVGYNRASRLVDQLEEAGILGPDQGGSQGRKVLAAEPKPTSTPRIIGGDDDDKRKPRVWF